MKFYVKAYNSNNRSEVKELRSQFLEAGLVNYTDSGYGIALLRKETIDKMLPTFIGCPVTIQHVDGSADDILKSGKAVGKVTSAEYNPSTGWFDCLFTVEDEEARKRIQDGWSVSCAFDSDDTGPGGEHHALAYKFEIVDGHFTHLALVPNPRYEDSKIFANQKCFINSKVATMIKENSKKEQVYKELTELGKLGTLGKDYHKFFRRLERTDVDKEFPGASVSDIADQIVMLEGGAQNAKEEVKCRHCGKPSEDRSGVCAACEKEYENSYSEAEQKAREYYLKSTQENFSISEFMKLAQLDYSASTQLARKIRQEQGHENAGKEDDEDFGKWLMLKYGISPTTFRTSQSVEEQKKIRAEYERAKKNSTPEQVSAALKKVPELLRTLGFDALAGEAKDPALAVRALQEALSNTRDMRYRQILEAAIDALKREGLNSKGNAGSTDKLYECEQCGKQEIHKSNHGGDIYPYCSYCVGQTVWKCIRDINWDEDQGVSGSQKPGSFERKSAWYKKKNAKVKLYMKTNAELKCLSCHLAFDTGYEDSKKNGLKDWQCCECGKQFNKKVPADGEMTCPGCGSTDIDVGTKDNAKANAMSEKELSDKLTDLVKRGDTESAEYANIDFRLRELKKKGMKENEKIAQIIFGKTIAELNSAVATEWCNEKASRLSSYGFFNAEGWVPQFKSWLKTVGDANGKSYAEMEKMWEHHVQINYDQSPTAMEFLQWNKLKGPQFNSKENSVKMRIVRA